jgi:hypothetical protein
MLEADTPAPIQTGLCIAVPEGCIGLIVPTPNTSVDGLRILEPLLLPYGEAQPVSELMVTVVWSPLRYTGDVALHFTPGDPFALLVILRAESLREAPLEAQQWTLPDPVAAPEGATPPFEGLSRLGQLFAGLRSIARR